MSKNVGLLPIVVAVGTVPVAPCAKADGIEFHGCLHTLELPA